LSAYQNQLYDINMQGQEEQEPNPKKEAADFSPPHE
jgi:hypothetical protein